LAILAYLLDKVFYLIIIFAKPGGEAFGAFCILYLFGWLLVGQFDRPAANIGFGAMAATESKLQQRLPYQLWFGLDNIN